MWHVLAHGRALACTLDPAYPWLAASSCVHTSQQRATLLHSPLLLIPLRGYPQNRRIRRVALLFSLSLFFFSSIFFPPYSPCCLCFAVFSVIRNGIASDRLAAERTGSFTREWSICRARRVPCFLFSRFYTLGVLLVNCLTCCLRVSFLSFFSSSWCGYFWD